MSDDQAIEKAPREVDAEEYTTTRKELWSYYLYYVGNNGLSGFNFGPSQFQNLLYLAGYDPKDPPFVTPCDDNCVLPYLGHVRDSEPISSSDLGCALIAFSSKFHCLANEWHQLCYSSCPSYMHRRMGRLWSLEVSSILL